MVPNDNADNYQVVLIYQISDKQVNIFMGTLHVNPAPIRLHLIAFVCSHYRFLFVRVIALQFPIHTVVCMTARVSKHLFFEMGVHPQSLHQSDAYGFLLTYYRI
jgi:hypothetical protein